MLVFAAPSVLHETAQAAGGVVPPGVGWFLGPCFDGPQGESHSRHPGAPGFPELSPGVLWTRSGVLPLASDDSAHPYAPASCRLAPCAHDEDH